MKYLLFPAVVAAYGMPKKTEFPEASSKPVTRPCLVEAEGTCSPLAALTLQVSIKAQQVACARILLITIMPGRSDYLKGSKRKIVKLDCAVTYYYTFTLKSPPIRVASQSS
jgi:hypothetical protein